MSLPSPSPLKSASPQIFSEVENPVIEATESDLEDYARRIGIDPVQEKYLLHLANEGLMQRLPSAWKPCFEPHKKSWFYYNQDSKQSQWEHPNDAIYRQKVYEARNEHALNRIKSFDMTSPKNLKNLPPLRMGGGLKPLPPLGPLAPLPGMKSGEGNSGVDGPKNKLQPLAIPTQLKKPPGGLVVTGGGASFLKSSAKPVQTRNSDESDEKSESSKETSGFRPKMIIPSAVSLGSPKSSLKGILANSMSRSPAADDRSNPLTNWDPNPSSMTDGEKSLWKRLEDSSTKKPRGLVKFNLEDPEIRFETSSQSQSEKVNAPKFDENESLTEKSTSNSTEEDENSEEISRSYGERITRPQKSILPGNSPNSTSTNVKKLAEQPFASNAGAKINPPSKPANQIGAGEKPSERNLVDENKAAKEEIRKIMEEQLKAYQDELELERTEREELIKKQTNKTLDGIKAQNEEKIKHLKSDLEKQSRAELERAKNEVDALYQNELKKLREENNEKMRLEKENILKENENALRKYTAQIEETDLTAIHEDKRKDAIAALEAQLKLELESIKDNLQDEQKREAQQIKDQHQTHLSQIKGEFQREEKTIREQQATLLNEIIAKYKKDCDEEIQKLKSTHKSELKKLGDEYESKKKSMEIQNDSLNSVASPSKSKKSKVPPTSPNKRNAQIRPVSAIQVAPKGTPLEIKERELQKLKVQYDELAEKYNGLKENLRNVVAAEQTRLKSNKLNDTNLNTSLVELNNTRNGGEVSSSEEAATSLDFSESDMRKTKQKEVSTRIEQLNAASSERVNQALSALELLREQIMDIKSEQELAAIRDNNEPNRRNMVSANSQKSAGPRRRNVYPVRKNSEKTNNYHPNRSNTDIPSMAEENDLSEEESRHQVVEEAKDFIRSQKERLSRVIPGFNLGNPQVQSHVHPLQQSRNKYGSLNNLHRKDALYSETESSGLGSLKSSPTIKDKVQVTKNIDSILLSLKKLDKQMKYLWTVVGSPGPINTYDSSHFTNVGPALLTPLVHPVSPPALAQLTRLYQNTNTDPVDYSGNSIPTPNTSLTSRYTIGPSFFNAANASLLGNLSRMSQANFNLEEHVNNLRNVQARISKLPNDDDLPPSLREKTKDLREWLEKF